ncbi:GGDEF domain-containing protein [Agrobacterium sp. CNPSo 3708]|uniref:GGDEF domain-containing protein n=1 Tax=Agrobacterium sp. CNPSo 3708 TaxID=3028150 RepID=UPI000713D050|nr:GGDEF domain-containing protein [Agrobacterium sp. CNPSo 3708]KQZ95149.1 diguanylate cyclase [Rhizobium sp. Root564]MDD1499349.1 GGDEF domain-containing protein [Agrobacterium sp. CNPSo 3708]
MATELDLPTVLFLQKTSYIAGAVTLGYLRLSFSGERGVGLLAVSFLILAAGSTLAGYAELHPALYGVLSLINIACAVLGYCLLSAAFVLVSKPKRKFHPWLVFVPMLGILFAGLVTQLHLNNTYRAVTFTSLGFLAFAATAVVVMRDARREPLPIRKLVAGTLAATSLLSLTMAIEFCFNTFPILGVVDGFSLMIISKFVLAVSIVIFISERQQTEIRQLANRDPLTGLYNRRAFGEIVPTRLQEGDAILFLDIDHFKQLNDHFGHAAGDQVLVMMAQAIQSTTPSSALLARQGGEEFVVFLPAEVGDAKLHAERIRKTVADLHFPAIASEIKVTISVGIARASRQRAGLSEVCRQADRALYLAKTGGRNRVCDADHNTLQQASFG